jgi:hypothetical protein
MPKPNSLVPLAVFATLAVLTTASLAIASPPLTKKPKPVPTAPKSTPLPTPKSTPKLIDNTKLNPEATITTNTAAIDLPQVDPNIVEFDSLSKPTPWTRAELAKTIQLDSSQLISMTSVNPSDEPQVWASGMRVQSSFVHAARVRTSYSGASGSEAQSAKLEITAQSPPANRTLLLSCRAAVMTLDTKPAGKVILLASSVRSNGSLTGRNTRVEASVADTTSNAGRRYGGATVHLTWTTQADEFLVNFMLHTQGETWSYAPGDCVLSEISS